MSFPVNQDDREQLISYLNVWYAQKKNLRNTANGTSGESIREYELWKFRFPQAINQYWKQQHERINAYYAPVKDSIKDKASPIETTSDFLCMIRNMIQSGLIFEVNAKMLDGNIAALKLSFLVDEMKYINSCRQNINSENEKPLIMRLPVIFFIIPTPQISSNAKQICLGDLLCGISVIHFALYYTAH